MKTIKSFEIINHGVEHSQYFQGCGIAFTKYEDIATGCGDNAKAALEDALESLAQNEWDTKKIKNELSEESQIPKVEDSENGEWNESNDVYHYVSVRVSSVKIE